MGTQLTKLLSSVPDTLSARFLDLKMKNEPNCHNIMAHGVRNHNIRICEHNLHTEHLILHIWSLCVGNQLTPLLSGVPDDFWVRFLDLKMKNEPNYHNIMAHGGQKSQYPHL